MEHSRYGYSAVSEFKDCPFKFDLDWNKHLEVIEDDDPKNALKIGTALHRAIETDFETAAKEYYASYPVITDQHITEMMKVEIQAKKVKKMLEGAEVKHETKIKTGEFIGTIDLLEDLGKFHFNMYDFKYSNNVDAYRDSPQLTIYKHFFEAVNKDCVIDNMYFIIVPKSNLKQLDGEDIQMYRKRLIADLKEPVIIESKYDEEKLQDYFKTVKEIKQTKVFPKKQNQFCYWCKYKDYCERGIDYMVLPSSERRTVGTPTKRKIWIYGATMSGKTTFLDDAPNPLNLNTDGNIQFVTMPYISIKDEVTVEGRLTKRKFAWEVFKEAIDELEKKQNDFKTIIVDLVEDTREMCRLYKYDQLGIEHESDSGYGKGWDIIKTEYLSVIRRLFNLDYENIVVISHEVKDEVKKKNGQTITTVYPNIQDKIANKIAGMVDIVARVVVEDDGSRTLNFKSNEFIFGGGRLKNITTTQIPLDWDELMKVYNCTPSQEKAVKNDSDASERHHTPKAREKFEPVEDGELLDKPEPIEEPVPRQRARRHSEPEQVTEAPQEETPKRRTRKTRA